MAAPSRTRKGKGRNCGLEGIGSQVGHVLINRANVPLRRLSPSFSLKSLKIRKGNLEKHKPLKRPWEGIKALRRPRGFEKLPRGLMAQHRLEMISTPSFYPDPEIFLGKNPLSCLKHHPQVFVPELLLVCAVPWELLLAQVRARGHWGRAALGRRGIPSQAQPLPPGKSPFIPTPPSPEPCPALCLLCTAPDPFVPCLNPLLSSR